MYSDLSKRHTGWNQASTFPQSGGRSSTSRYSKRPGEPTRRKGSLLKCTIWIFIGLVVVGFLGFAVLNGTSDTSVDEDNSGREVARLEEREASETVRRENVKNDGEYGPKIKGLRLGMKYDDVNAIVKQLCDQHNSSSPKYVVRLDCSEKDCIFLRSVAKDTGNFCQFRFYEGRLASFGLEGEVLQMAFGVSPSSVSDVQLLQMFIDHYGIPKVKTQVFTFTNQSRFGVGGGVETLSYYDGSESEGYSFEFRGYRGTGTCSGQQKWSFDVRRYLGWNFDLPPQISMSEVEDYQYGFGPVIKGFQLGMTRADALKLSKKIWRNSKPIEKGDRIYFEVGDTFPDLDFRFKNGKVCKFNISGQLFVWLFRANPQYQGLKDFAQSVVDAYHIPRMQGKSKSTSNQVATCYDCTKDGIEFWVEENRKANNACWSIGCRQIDISKFD